MSHLNAAIPFPEDMHECPFVRPPTPTSIRIPRAPRTSNMRCDAMRTLFTMKIKPVASGTTDKTRQDNYQTCMCACLSLSLSLSPTRFCFIFIFSFSRLFESLAGGRRRPVTGTELVDCWSRKKEEGGRRKVWDSVLTMDFPNRKGDVGNML